MLSSSELPLWQRITVAAMLIGVAWFVKESETLMSGVGESAVQLTAGVAALSVLLGGGVVPGLWPVRLKRASFSWPAALLLSAVGALVIVLASDGGLAANEWQFDKGGALGLVVGGAVWSAAFGASKLPRPHLWIPVAVGGGLLPGIVGISVLRAGDRILSVDGNMLLSLVGFLLVAETARALVADELAFRRMLVGRTGGVGLLMVAVGAFVYGIWCTFLPEAGTNLLLAFLMGFARGIAAGSLYVMSRSLLVSSVFTGFLLASTSGGLRALSAGGTSEEHLARYWNSAVMMTVLIAAGFAYALYRAKGMGGFGEYKVGIDATDS
jgi:hypothetical protein